jgi:hypothetical protein
MSLKPDEIVVETDEGCPNCGGAVLSQSLRLQASPINESFELLVEGLHCTLCGAEWEEWD